MSALNYAVRFAYSSRVDFDMSPEPDAWLTALTASLLYIDPSDSTDASDTEVGGMTGTLFNIGRAFDYCRDPFSDVFDCQGGDELEAYYAVFTREKIRRAVAALCGSTPLHYLYIDRLRINSDHRNRGLGLRLLGGLMRSPLLPARTLMVLLPMALGHERGSDAQKKGTLKLRRYYKKVGFSSVPGNSKYLMSYVE